jgi:hypothetical protein
LNPDPGAIDRTAGWILSERIDFNSVVEWNIENSSGIHEFPFGKKNEYIPVMISIVAGDLGTVSIATYSTNPANQPLPFKPWVNNTIYKGIENSLSMVNRFWYIRSSGTGKASYTLTYGSEETTEGNGIKKGIAYDLSNHQWMEPLCCQATDVYNRKVTIPGVAGLEIWTLIDESEPLLIGEYRGDELEAEKTQKRVNVYPVPTHNFLILDYNGLEESPVSFILYSFSGERMGEGYFTNNSGNLYTIDFSGIKEKGIYYLKVMNSFSVKDYKILVE